MSHVAEIAALRPHLMRVALSRVRDPHNAEEVVQETLLAALRTRTAFAGRSRFRTWMTGILLHKVADLFRQKAREAKVIEPQEDFDEDGAWCAPVAEWSHPEAALENKRFRAAFDAGLSRLPSQQSRAFVLREVQGLEVDAVCEAMQVTPNNLGVILHRARLQLRRSLERDYFSAAA